MKTLRLDKPELARVKAEIFKALGHPTRLLIVEALAKRPHCVCELVEVVPGAQPTTSRHLEVLRRAGVIRRYKEGVKMIYELALPCVLNALPCITEAVKERLAAEKRAFRGL